MSVVAEYAVSNNKIYLRKHQRVPSIDDSPDLRHGFRVGRSSRHVHLAIDGHLDKEAGMGIHTRIPISASLARSAGRQPMLLSA